MSTMTNFAAEHYAPRAHDYVLSAVHAGGADLDEIETVVHGRKEARVLDLGCGGGHVSYRAAPHVAEVVACDVTASMLDAVAETAAERGLRNIAVQQAPAESLPFADGTFDVVLCRFTTHHWTDMEAGLREARRVLKSGAPARLRGRFCASRACPRHASASRRNPARSLARAQLQRGRVGRGLGQARFAVEGLTVRTLRMDFPVWIARTKTPALQAEAIRALQAGASRAVRDHFAIAPDGSFDIQSATFRVRAA